MICAHPDRPVKARGVCASCYDRAWKTRSQGRVRGLNSGGLPAQIVDLLEIDGGWLTSDGVALCFPKRDPRHVDRTLYRLRSKGLVESRLVTIRESMNDRTGVVYQLQRVEWRAA